MTKPHNFKVGDKVIIADHNSTVGIYLMPCYIDAIEGNTYIMRKRDFNTQTFRIGRYYPHIKIG